MVAYPTCLSDHDMAKYACDVQGGRLPSFDTQEKWDLFQDTISKALEYQPLDEKEVKTVLLTIIQGLLYDVLVHKIWLDMQKSKAGGLCETIADCEMELVWSATNTSFVHQSYMDIGVPNAMMYMVR